MKKLVFLSIIALLVFYNDLSAQSGVAINSTGGPADNSAMLDIKSNNKGVLIPRVSSVSRKAIANPAVGLMVFDSTEGTLYMFDGMRWLGFQGMPDNLRPTSKLIFPPDQQDTLLAGYSVSVWNEFAVIGAPYRNGPASLSGGAYVYRRSGDSWYHFTTLVPSSGAVDTALFGVSVSICGNNIIVGAPHKKNAIGQRIGAAYIFTFNGSAWVNSHVLWGTSEGMGYGYVVDISEAGNYAVVSEPGATANGFQGAGMVRVYNKTASWFLQASLSDPAPHAGEGFGASLAISPAGTYIVAGAPGKTVGGQQGNGYAGIFSRSGIVWSHMHSFQGSGGIEGLRTGQIVDVTNTKLLIINGGTKTVNYFNIGAPWSTFPHVYSVNIDGACIDPVTEEFYIWSSPNIYRGGTQKVKTISATDHIYSFPNLFSVYGDRFVLGRPGEQSPSGIHAGGYFFGVASNEL